MVKSVSALSLSSLALVATTVLGASVPDGTWPTSQGTVQYSEVYVIAAGETFDGGMKTYDRSDITCEGQEESGTSTAVFSLEAGATLKNAIIGTNQMEGVHCDDSDCTIENVWWDDVCEDALSIKGGSASSVSTVTGGGARYADDKVVQHNGYGTVVIDGFYAEDFGKLYRSCGTCGDRQRFVSVSNVYVVDPGVSIVTVNDNYGDEATLSNIWISASDDSYDVCAWSEGSEDGEPTELGAGIKDPLCQYSESDIHVNEDVSTATSTSASTTSTSTTSSTASSYGEESASSLSEASASSYSEESASSYSEETTTSTSEETTSSTSEEESGDDVYTVATVTPEPSTEPEESASSEETDDDVYSVATVTPEPSTEPEESASSEETAEEADETAGEATETEETTTAPTSTSTSSCKTRMRRV